MQTFTDILAHRSILSKLIDKEFKAQYRNMTLGTGWTLLNPMVLVGVLSVVWTFVFKAEPGFPAFVIVALIPYNFVTYCLNGCASSIHGNVTLVKRIRFPRQILPISVILTHLIHFAIQSVLIVGAIFLFSPHPTAVFSWNLLWLPVVLLIHIGLSVGIGLLVAGLTVIYRDVQYFVEAGLNVMFWGSPIIYSLEDALPRLTEEGREWIYYVFSLNPLSGILEGYRSILYYGACPDPFSLGIAAFLSVLVGYVGVKSFWKHERNFADMM